MDNLIGLSSTDPYSQPTHRRSTSASHSNTSSPGTSVVQGPRHTHSVPIPRPASQIHRPGNRNSDGNSTPLSHSPSSSESPFPFSPLTHTHSIVSPNTNATSPPSSYSFNNANIGIPSRTLTYPSVPPPSLSSSFGSPAVSYHMHSPVESLSRRDSGARRSVDWRVPGHSEERSRRNSVERGARVAETGTLIPRSRAGSQALPPTTEAPDTVDGDGATWKGYEPKVPNGVESR